MYMGDLDSQWVLIVISLSLSPSHSPFPSLSSPSSRVDHWDLEKERLLVLTDNNLVSVRYNFISGLVEELKYIPIAAITNIVFGEFKYPSSYG